MNVSVSTRNWISAWITKANFSKSTLFFCLLIDQLRMGSGIHQLRQNRYTNALVTLLMSNKPCPCDHPIENTGLMGDVHFFHFA